MVPIPRSEAAPHRSVVVCRAGRAVVDRQTIHVQDVAAEAQTEFPGIRRCQRAYWHSHCPWPRHYCEKVSRLELFLIRRTEVRPFTDKQIALLKTFADQAVIAIENVRLFQELEARTRELARSVGELKALGEVGQAVSSTLDLQTVLSTIVAMRSSSPEPMAVSFTSTMRLRKSFISGRATVWKKSWLRRFGQHRSVWVKALRSSSDYAGTGSSSGYPG